MSAISDFVRNIAVFMIFAGFVGVIVPDGKYKGYVNVVLGLILVLLLINPVAALLRGDLSEVFADMGLRYDRSVINSYVYDDDAQNELILETYRNNLSAQLKRLTAGFTGYEYISSDFTVGNGDDFGEILAIKLELSKTGAPQVKTGVPLIRIEPVTITGTALPGTTPAPQTEDDELLDMKKTISDFYNVTSSNIYIQFIY